MTFFLLWQPKLRQQSKVIQPKLIPEKYLVITKGKDSNFTVENQN